MAAKIMTKAAVVAYLADKAELTKRQVSELMEHLHVLAAKEAKKDGFVVPGFGKLVLRNRKARMGRNPQTGAAIKIPAKRVVRLRVAKAMKDAILGGKK
jgi:DNA-binding protein HU-beta